jgi:porin
MPSPATIRLASHGLRPLVSRGFCFGLLIAALPIAALPIAAHADDLAAAVATPAPATQSDAAAPTPPPALTYGGDFWLRQKLTGDWGGTRDDLAAHGITFDLSTAYTLQGVAGGGIPSTGTDLGNTLWTSAVLGLDTGKAGLWQGGSLTIRLEDRTGESALKRTGAISPVNIDALFPDAPGDLDQNVFGLTELSYTQFLNRQFAVFGGLLNTTSADDNPIAGNVRRNETFLNSAFLLSPVESAGAPETTLGGGGVFILSPEIHGSVSVLNTQESATLNPFDNSQGTTFATEWTAGHQLFGQPGGQVLGFLYSINASRTNIALDPRVFLLNLIVLKTIPTTTADTWAFYYNAHQYIQGDEHHGWGPFVRFGISDGDPNPIKYNIAAGLGGKGTFPGRDDDRWGLGLYYLDMSDAGLLAGLNIGNELGGEAFYNFAITPALHLTFDAQAVSSARPRQDTAIVLASRLKIDF